MDLVRIYLGAGLFVKALYLMAHREYLNSIVEQAGNLWFGPAAIAQYVIMVHLLGGILLALGLITRVAAWFQVPVLLGAVFYVFLPRVATTEPRQYLEYSALVLFLLVLFGVFGAGRWSLDYYLERRMRESAESQMAPREAH